jgi:ABC-type dipeptide/oligopeptide/nickel transport system permease subunit
VSNQPPVTAAVMPRVTPVKIAPHPVGEIVDFDYFGPMTREFWLGTDYLGRDMLSRITMQNPATPTGLRA